MGVENRQAAIDLQRIVAINEEIKAVVATAFRVNVMALNAIIISKKAGVTCRGFGVVSNEQRAYSRQLQECMQELRSTTYRAVDTLSMVLKQHKFTQIFQRTRSGSTKAALQLDRVLAEREVRLQAFADDLRQCRKALSFQVDEANRLGELGSILARAAKIEAAYGSEFRDALRQTAADFELEVTAINRSLSTVVKELRRF